MEIVNLKIQLDQLRKGRDQAIVSNRNVTEIGVMLLAIKHVEKQLHFQKFALN